MLAVAVIRERVAQCNIIHCASEQQSCSTGVVTAGSVRSLFEESEWRLYVVIGEAQFKCTIADAVLILMFTNTSNKSQ